MLMIPGVSLDGRTAKVIPLVGRTVSLLEPQQAPEAQTNYSHDTDHLTASVSGIKAPVAREDSTTN